VRRIDPISWVARNETIKEPNMSSIKTAFQAAVKATVSTAAQLLPAKKTALNPAPAGAEKKPGPDPAAPEQLLAWAMPAVNRTLLVAYKPGTDPTNPTNLVSVRVRSNHNFLPHMKLRVQHVEGTTYNLVGPLPRWRGRY